MAYSTCNVFRNRHNSHSLTASYRSRYYALSKVPRHSLNALKAFFCGGGGGGVRGGMRYCFILFHQIHLLKPGKHGTFVLYFVNVADKHSLSNSRSL